MARIRRRAQLSSNPRIYRATANAHEKGIPRGSCWSEDIETAEAYTDDPGFGGEHLRSVEADLSSVLDIAGARRPFEELAEALGYPEPERQAEDWQLRSWIYPWEESSDVRRRLEQSGYDWLRYIDDYPEGAITLMKITPNRSLPRRMVRNADDIRVAKKHRETFMDREAKRQRRVPWEWPKSMQWIGSNEAVMYASDKWHKAGDYEEYKHVSEGEQYLLAAPGFVRDYRSGKAIPLDHETFRMPSDMPKAFADLAEIFGIQMKTLDERYLQIDIKRAKLGGATHPDLGTFLFVYTGAGVHLLICGDKLNIEKDGITG